MDKSTQDERRNRVVAQAFQCRRALEVYAFSMLKDRAEAEDLVQDAFIVVMEKFEVFEEGTSMLAWTRAIVRLKVLQSLEKRNRRAKLLDQLLYDAVDASFEEVASDRYAEEIRNRGRRLAHCLEKLGERSRTLLNCVYVERMSYEGASRSTGMGFEAVKKNLQRAKAQLRKCIQRTQIEPSA